MPSPRPGRSSAPNAFAFAGTTRRLRPVESHPQRAERPCDRRLGCFDRPSASTISNRSSITKNSAKSTTESALKRRRRLAHSLPGFAISAVFRRAQWVGNPSTKAARMSIPSMHSLCAMASRKCERTPAVPDEFGHRQAVSGGSNIQKLEGCGASMRKSLHRALFARGCAVMAVLVPASGVVILTTRLSQAKRAGRRIC